MSVYYVNCDVDASAPAANAVASSVTASKPGVAEISDQSHVVSTPKLHPAVEFGSSASGADIYLDGIYVGKTPLTTRVEPGMHKLVISKQDFSTWQQKVEVSAAGRKVSAYLDRKFLMLE